MHLPNVFLILALVSRGVFANDDDQKCHQSFTISSQSDADNLGDCDTIYGNVNISSTVAGSIRLNDVQEIKGTLTAEPKSGLTQLIASDLETIGGGMAVRNLDSLINVTMDSLSQVSAGISIEDNPKLEYLELDNLNEVDGTLDLIGSFISISLSSLDHINGATKIHGGNKMSCDTLNQMQSDGVYRGGYSCESSGGSSLSPGAIGGIAAGAIVGVILIILLMWCILRQRRKHRRSREVHGTPSVPPAGVLEKKPPRYQPVPAEDRQMSPPLDVSVPSNDGRLSLYDEPPSPEQAVSTHELFLPPNEPNTTRNQPNATQEHPSSLSPGQAIPLVERRLTLPHDRAPPVRDHRLSMPADSLLAAQERRLSVPRKPLVPPPAQLDGQSIYEAPYPISPVPEYHELDGGPVFGRHQQAINGEP